MRKLLVGCVGILCVACQTYAPVPFTGIRPGNDVRMAVTNEGSLAVAPSVGRDVSSVEGKVRAVDSAGVTLLVESVNRGTDVSERVDTSLVHLGPSSVTTAELRRIDKPKSFIVAALIIAGAAAIAQGSTGGGFFGLGRGSSGGSR